MKLDETILIEIQDYINELDEKVGLKPETIEDVLKAIDKHRTELKNLRLVVVSKSLSSTPCVCGDNFNPYRDGGSCWNCETGNVC
jgi:hypothetical protein